VASAIPNKRTNNIRKNIKNFGPIPQAIQRKEPLLRPGWGYPKAQVLVSAGKEISGAYTTG